MNEIINQAKLIKDDLIKYRRTIHSNPEVGQELPKTKAYVIDRLKEMGYSFEINTFDSGIQENSLNELLSSGALDKMELIIGAMYPKHNKELAKFAQEKGIPLVIPFTNKEKEIK